MKNLEVGLERVQSRTISLLDCSQLPQILIERGKPVSNFKG